jgi:hypothetical protein
VFDCLAEVIVIIRWFVHLGEHLFTVVETRAHASPLRIVSDIHGWLIVEVLVEEVCKDLDVLVVGWRY